jgi:hypothetical protein
MQLLLTDAEISGLIAEPKELKIGVQELLQLKQRVGHKGKEVDIQGKKGTRFRVILRQSDFNIFDFSAILAFYPPKTNELFRLRRYNGKSHEHRNKIEGDKFYDFHIHCATERYQNLGYNEDAYAQTCSRYTDLQTALKCLLADCAFNVPDQLTIFSLKP